MLRSLLAPRWQDLAPEYCALLGLMRRASGNSAVAPLIEPHQCDSAKLATLVLHHGLAPWLLHSLKAEDLQLAPASLDALKKSVKRNHARAMAAFALQLKLVKALQEAGIAALPVKGVSTALRLYGDLGLRQVGDLDIMVPPAKLDAACEVFKALGLVMTFPKRTLNKAERAWVMRRRHHFNFNDPVTGFLIELHWAFHDDTMLDDDDRRWAETANEQLFWAGRTLPALDAVTDYLLLLTHLLRTGCRRLSTLLDISRAWDGLGEAGQEEAQAQLVHYRMIDSHQRTLRAAAILLGKLDCPARPPHEFAYANAFQDGQRGFMVVDAINLMRARRGWRYRLDVVQQQALTWTDMDELQLSAPWFALYGPLRLPMMARRLLLGRGLSRD